MCDGLALWTLACAPVHPHDSGYHVHVIITANELQHCKEVHFAKDWQQQSPGCALHYPWRYVNAAACRYLVSGARALGLEVIDRCNLTVLLEPGQEDLVDFLAENQVSSVACWVRACPQLCPAFPGALKAMASSMLDKTSVNLLVGHVPSI